MIKSKKTVIVYVFTTITALTTFLSSCKPKPVITPKVKHIEIPVNGGSVDNFYYVQAYENMIDSINSNINEYDSLAIVLNGKKMEMSEVTLTATNLGQIWAIAKTDNKMQNGNKIDNRIPSNVSVTSRDWNIKVIYVSNNKWKERNMNSDGSGFTPIQNPNVSYTDELFKTLKVNYIFNGM